MSDHDNLDTAALERLMDYTRDALAAQPPESRVPLSDALAEGRVDVTVEDRDGHPHALVTVDGQQVASVDVRNLIPLDDAL